MPLDFYTNRGAEIAGIGSVAPSRPTAVKASCLLIVSAFVISLVAWLPEILWPPPDEPAVSLLLMAGVIIFFGSLTVWFAIAILRGKVWARWAMLIFLILGWVLVGVDLRSEFARTPIVTITDIVCVIMELIACFLLFFGAGAKWFSALALPKQDGTKNI